jgi:hypothetical protein
MNEKKFSFLFQGRVLAFVLATILIPSAPCFVWIRETGGTKMSRNLFPIEQTPTQSPAVDNTELMRVYRSYELF